MDTEGKKEEVVSSINSIDGDIQKLKHGKNFKRGIAVYACQSDVKHPTLLRVAQGAGVLSKDRYNILSTTEEELTPKELGDILENYFGFCNGDYEQHLIEGVQRTRFGMKVFGEYRYCGSERTDKDWCDTGLASVEAVETMKYGEALVIDCGDSQDESEINKVVFGK